MARIYAFHFSLRASLLAEAQQQVLLDADRYCAVTARSALVVDVDPFYVPRVALACVGRLRLKRVERRVRKWRPPRWCATGPVTGGASCRATTA